MIYVNDQQALDAEAVSVVKPSEVQTLVHQGWRILAAFAKPKYDEVQFIMGRDGDRAALADRLELAESERRSAEQDVMALEAECDRLKGVVEGLEGGQRSLLDNVKVQTEVSARAAERLLEVQHQAGLVRKEIGEARWREILHALEMEDVLGKPETITVSTVPVGSAGTKAGPRGS